MQHETRAEGVVESLRRAFADHADEPALVFGDTQLTHAELDARSDSIAAALAGRGIGPGDRVGLLLDRGADLIIALVGILRSGAAYVPLDPGYPADRIAYMADNAQLATVLAADHLSPVLGSIESTTPGELVAPGQPTADPETPGPTDAAYVMYTSGSTGLPKGVEMPHRAMANLIRWQLQRESFSPGARVLQFASVSFDVSFQEIITTLASGGCLIATSEDDRRDPQRLADLMRRHDAHRVFLPFAALRTLIDVIDPDAVAALPLRDVITAGEQLRVDDRLRTFFATCGASLDNHYGPTETHVITAHRLEGPPSSWPDLPPIGTPIDGCTVVIRDADGREVTPGTIGELHLGGIALANGYFADEARTRERFRPAPGGDGPAAVEYVSGDLGRMDPDGTIQYLGRGDDQVKIRGHRVEPSEVSAIAGGQPGVANCVTVARSRTTGGSYLVTYVEATAGTTIDPAAIRGELAAVLPSHMVPAFVLEVPALPTTGSGKVDTRNLPAPGEVGLDSGAPPRGDTEVAVAEIWERILGFSGLPRDLSFFDLGGDSLEAARLMRDLRARLGADLPLAALASHSTIAALAELIDAPEQATSVAGLRATQLLRAGSPDVAPLFLIHGGGGNVLIFNDLAMNLPLQQTVYGLQWPGWDGDRAPSTVAAMAAAYADEIRTVQPEGPYRLGGHCLGGLIAIEVARLLTASGGAVEGPLIVSDAPNLAASSYRAADPADAEPGFQRMCDDLLAAVPAALRDDGWRGAVPEPVDPDAPVWRPTGVRGLIRRVPYLRPALRKAKSAAERAVVVGHLLARRPVPPGWRLRYCQQTLRPAARRHTPKRYNGDVVYFRTATPAGRDMALSGWWTDIHLGFAELVGGDFTAHVVGGGHNDALEGPFAARVIEAAFTDA